MTKSKQIKLIIYCKKLKTLKPSTRSPMIQQKYHNFNIPNLSEFTCSLGERLSDNNNSKNIHWLHNHCINVLINMPFI